MNFFTRMMTGLLAIIYGVPASNPPADLERDPKDPTLARPADGMMSS